MKLEKGGYVPEILLFPGGTNPGGGKSFFSPEDVYSNRLGVWFRNEMKIFNRRYENWSQNFGYWLSHSYSLSGSGN